MNTIAPRPEAIIFDIGNVLLRWQPEEHYDRWIGEERRRAMFDAVDLHFMNELVDRGGDFRDIVYDTAEKYPEFRTEIRWWHDRWLDLASPVIDLSVATMRALKAHGISVFVLSNIGRGSFAITRDAHAFFDEFDRLYISGHMGVTKPSPDIYAMVEADCGISPKRLLFADDRIDNINTASARGWQTHHFTDPRHWADDLIARGLIKETDL
ncbi:HAD family hydrolase [Aliiroseovarius marinus]|uniref:HAD family hydrolase n=1 Tax=Aliiroseovarius marinus TaxID=2500159 RepID=UPI003D7CD05A